MLSPIPVEGDWLWAFSFNLILIAFFQRYSLLTPKGWIHAGALGTILWGCLGWRGWLAVVIYLILGSLVTKFGFKNKSNKGIAEGRGGRRGPENVWGSAATGTIIAILIRCEIGSQAILLIGFVASFAAKLADTFGSELGKVWGTKTFLITSFKTAKPGTDGAISIEGTVASLAGSLIMTSAMACLSLVPNSLSFLIIVTTGFLATIIESIIGATIQKRFKSLTNELVNFLQTTLSSIIAIIAATIIF